MVLNLDHKLNKKEKILNLDFLRSLVNEDTFIHNAEGINQAMCKLGESFVELGAHITFHKSSTENLSALQVDWGNNTLPPVTLVCHMDVVQKVSDDHRYKVDFVKKKIYGPGIIDNKTGVFIAHELIRSIRSEVDPESLHIRIVVSPSEERGSPGFHKLFNRLGREAPFVFGLEPSTSQGELIQSRSGNRWYELSFKGKSYHSGRIEETELSLGNEILIKASELITLAKSKDGVKLNLSFIESDSKIFNTTCSELKLRFDLRFIDHKLRDELDKKITSFEHWGIDFDIEIYDDCPAMQISSKREQVLELYNKNLEYYGVSRTSYVHSCGAADVNYFSTSQNVVLDGFGGVGGNMHRKDEFVEIQSLGYKLFALKETIKELACSLSKV